MKIKQGKMQKIKFLNAISFIMITFLSVQSNASEKLNCPKVDGAAFSKALNDNMAVKNWKFELRGEHQNVTVRDPKTISTSLEKQDERICYYSVMKHKVSYHGPQARPDLEATGVQFSLTRERAFCPAVSTDQLKEIANKKTIFVSDESIKAQEGAILKAVDGNATRNIHMAVQGLADQSFGSSNKIAEQKGPFSDVCIYPINAHGINEVWLTAVLKD